MTFRALLLEKTEEGFRRVLKDLPDDALPDGDVLIKIQYSTLNYKDGLAICDKAPVVRTWPMVPGFDGAGTVIETGLTIVNDMSARDHVFRPGVPVGSPFHWDWMSQKCFTGAKPMGPWIVPMEAISDPANLTVRLWVNGRLMQDSSSCNMIFDMAEQVRHLSTRVTLLPGDVIATGTPAGVGMESMQHRGRLARPG